MQIRLNFFEEEKHGINFSRIEFKNSSRKSFQFQGLINQIKEYLVMSQSEDVEHSSAYCLATTIGARHTLAPPVADTSHTRPLSQSASRRHNSPILRP